MGTYLLCSIITIYNKVYKNQRKSLATYLTDFQISLPRVEPSKILNLSSFTCLTTTFILGPRPDVITFKFQVPHEADTASKWALTHTHTHKSRAGSSTTVQLLPVKTPLHDSISAAQQRLAQYITQNPSHQRRFSSCYIQLCHWSCFVCIDPT